MCSASARFVARIDRKGLIGLAPLQGEFSRGHGLSVHASATGGSLVMYEEREERCVCNSDAVLELMDLLGWPWRALLVARWVPRSWRDGLYRWVADHRHRLFARGEYCELGDERVRSRLRK